MRALFAMLSEDQLLELLWGKLPADTGSNAEDQGLPEEQERRLWLTLLSPLL